MSLLTRSKLSLAVGFTVFAAACSAPMPGDDDGGTGGGSIAANGGGTSASGGGTASAGGGMSTGGGSTAAGGGMTSAGGGTSATGGGSTLPDSGTPTDGGLTIATRMAAASQTATTNALCTKIEPFYWQVGDVTGELGGGSIGAMPDGGTYDGDSFMSIASASKWLYSTYFVQKTNGVLSSDDISFFNFWAGYTDFSACPATSTVSSCLDVVNSDGTTNGQLEAANVGKFFYSGGHMQKHAALNGLGAMGRAALATEIRSQLGTEVTMTYSQPQLAGGVITSANEYAKVLRKIIGGQLKMHDILGSHAVCTNPHTCALALASPLAVAGRNLSFSYSIGHWVETDPASDGSFSSAGSFGFYPWIDSTISLYGIVAREDSRGSGFDSYDCGHLIRTAWQTGVAQ